MAETKEDVKDVEQDDSFKHREDDVHSEDSVWKKNSFKRKKLQKD